MKQIIVHFFVEFELIVNNRKKRTSLVFSGDVIVPPVEKGFQIMHDCVKILKNDELLVSSRLFGVLIVEILLN